MKKLSREDMREIREETKIKQKDIKGGCQVISQEINHLLHNNYD